MSGPAAEDPTPHSAYDARLQARRTSLEEARRRDRTFSILRALAALAALAAWALAGGAGLAAGALVFIALVVAHARTVRARDDAARRVAFYEAAAARLRGDWAGHGEAGARFLDPAHPYAADLDLFGRGSLFERLCTAVTRSGQETLAAWLLAPAAVGAVRERQAAVAELRPRLDLREDLAALGAVSRGGVDSVALRAWLAAAPHPLPAPLLAAGAALATLNAATLAMALSGVWSTRPFLASAVATAALAFFARSWTQPTLAGVERPAAALRTLAALLARVERERFATPLLARLHAGLGSERDSPAQRVARLRTWTEIHESRRNVLFAPIAFLLLADLRVAAAVERWRARSGAALAAALAALGALEALSSLAAYAFESPDDAVPDLDEEGPLLAAEGIAHPLLPAATAVRNDVRLDAARGLLVVSGSNMSGKSTFLRTLGVATVMALAGAPVRARALRISPLAVGASIRIQDSLQEGRSRFYAEVLRVRQVMELAGGAPPLLFLLDEIFHGTNSADRSVGAEAVVRALLRRGAIGLVTSHDLALADVADQLAPAAANVHFEDHLEDGVMAFDYRLRPGRVERSNALALMRAVGLEV